MADLAAAGAAQELHLADRERREVVVQHEALPRLAVDRLDLLRVVGGAERAVTSACVSPRVKSAEPWTRGSTPTSIQIGRISSNGGRRAARRARGPRRADLLLEVLEDRLGRCALDLVLGNARQNSSSTWSTPP